MNKEALEEHIKLLQATGASAQEMDRHHRIYAEKGWRGLDEQDLKWQLGEWQKDSWHFTTFEIAGCYARLGNKDQAFTWLNKGVELRSTILWMLDAAPDFASLRSAICRTETQDARACLGRGRSNRSRGVDASGCWHHLPHHNNAIQTIQTIEERRYSPELKQVILLRL